MSVVATDTLIVPHGGTLVDRTGDRPGDLDSLAVVALTAREVSDLDMLASGALSPLEGFMGREDYESVVESMRLANGLPWALPVCLAVDEAPAGDRVALADASGRRPRSASSRSTRRRRALPSPNAAGSVSWVSRLGTRSTVRTST